MKHLKKCRGYFAVAGVLEALLLISLVAIILSMIQIVYIPDVMKDREADHMEEVTNQFSNLKSTIEIQSMMGIMSSGEPIAYAPMSSPITLGSEQLPYFVTMAGSGQLRVIDKDKTESKIVIKPFNPGGYPSGINLTSIEYIANNFYFYSQKYILEGGGIVRVQEDNETMVVHPAMAIEETLLTIDINFYIPIFVSPPGKNLTGGFTESFVRTNYTRYTKFLDNDIDNITIFSDYLKGWNYALVHNNTGLLWEYINSGDILVTYKDSQYILIEPLGKEIDIEFTMVEIGVQVGEGVVIQRD
jgi:hypothetical protein